MLKLKTKALLKTQGVWVGIFSCLVFLCVAAGVGIYQNQQTKPTESAQAKAIPTASPEQLVTQYRSILKSLIQESHMLGTDGKTVVLTGVSDAHTVKTLQEYILALSVPQQDQQFHLSLVVWLDRAYEAITHHEVFDEVFVLSEK